MGAGRKRSRPHPTRPRALDPSVSDSSVATPSERHASVGIFGGSGFYDFIESPKRFHVDTPYGPTSSPIHAGTMEGVDVAFMPRHGEHHENPSHIVNYRANIWAMKQIGVDAIVSPCAAGSLQPSVQPGDFVILDQLVDRTRGRDDTFYMGPIATHISLADPYCPSLRNAGALAATQSGINVHETGTVVVIQGPRFSTKAESRWFANQGWEVINMTQYPEAALARELEICFLGIALITDYDVGVEDVAASTVEEIVETFSENNERLAKLLWNLVPRIPEKRDCDCRNALDGAQLNTRDF